MSDEKDNLVIRPLRLAVTCADDDYRYVVNSLKQYRAAVRHAFAVFATAQMAGAKIEQRADEVRVVGNNDAAKTILAKAMSMSVQQRTKPAVAKALKNIADILAKAEGKTALTPATQQRLDEAITAVSEARETHNWADDVTDAGAAPGYEVRSWVLSELLPHWSAFVFDGLRRDLVSLWSANDPEHPKATRGYLMLNGARQLARFARVGISFPAATATGMAIGERSITLKWHDRAVKFHVGTLDPQSWHTFQQVRDGVWNYGSLELTERNGHLRVIIPVKRPAKREDLDQDKTAALTLSEAGVLSLTGEAEPFIFDLQGVVSQLRRMKAQRVHLEACRASNGSSVQKWGNKKSFRAEQHRIGRLTLARTNYQTGWNHLFSRRIVEKCVRERCGQLRWTCQGEGLLGEPWAWSQFENFLKYKCDEAGIDLVKEER